MQDVMLVFLPNRESYLNVMVGIRDQFNTLANDRSVLPPSEEILVGLAQDFGEMVYPELIRAAIAHTKNTTPWILKCLAAHPLMMADKPEPGFREFMTNYIREYLHKFVPDPDEATLQIKIFDDTMAKRPADEIWSLLDSTTVVVDASIAIMEHHLAECGSHELA